MPETVLPMIPDVPADMTARQRPFASSLKEIIEVREGRRGDPLDAFVSIRDLREVLHTDETIISYLTAYHGHNADHIAAGTFGTWYSATPGTYIFPQGLRVNGDLAVGVDDTTAGIVSVYGGGAGADGGVIKLYLGADDDATIASFNIQIVEDDLQIGPNTDPNGLKLTSDKDFYVTAGDAYIGGRTANALTIGSGAAGVDYSLTFNGETNDGVITWMEAEDYFQIGDSLIIPSTEQIYFRDTEISIQSLADGYLDLVADNGVRFKYGTQSYVADKTLSESDLLQAHIMDVSGDDRSFFLPDISATHLGKWIILVRAGTTHSLSIIAGGTDAILNSSAGGRLICTDPDHDYSAIFLFVVADGVWSVPSFGIWSTQ